MVDQLAELSLFDANVGSLAELNDLPLMTGLRSLNLHANRVSQIGQHLERQTRLTYLNLSSNRLERMEGLHTLGELQVLDLSCNLIRMIDGLAASPKLRRLLLGYNQLESLAGLVQCHGGPLECFEAPGNRIALLRETEYLRGFAQLREVTLSRNGQANPLCDQPGYQQHVIALLPVLRVLDGAATADVGAAASKSTCECYRAISVCFMLAINPNQAADIRRFLPPP